MTVLNIKQGATFYRGFTWRSVELDDDGVPVKDGDGNYVLGDPIPLTDCTARMQIRKKVGDPILVTATSVDPGDPLDQDLIAAGAGRIKLESDDKDGNPRPGHIAITLTDLDTMALTIKAGVFDLEITFPQASDEIRPRVERPLEGTVSVDLNVTVDA